MAGARRSRFERIAQSEIKGTVELSKTYTRIIRFGLSALAFLLVGCLQNTGFRLPYKVAIVNDPPSVAAKAGVADGLSIRGPDDPSDNLYLQCTRIACRGASSLGIGAADWIFVRYLEGPVKALLSKATGGVSMDVKRFFTENSCAPLLRQPDAWPDIMHSGRLAGSEERVRLVLTHLSWKTILGPTNANKESFRLTDMCLTVFGSTASVPILQTLDFEVFIGIKVQGQNEVLELFRTDVGGFEPAKHVSAHCDEHLLVGQHRKIGETEWFKRQGPYEFIVEVVEK